MSCNCSLFHLKAHSFSALVRSRRSSADYGWIIHSRLCHCQKPKPARALSDGFYLNSSMYSTCAHSKLPFTEHMSTNAACRSLCQCETETLRLLHRVRLMGWRNLSLSASMCRVHIIYFSFIGMEKET